MAAFPRIRALLVTADREILQSVGAAVAQAGLGYVLQSATSRDELFYRLRADHPDVVLLAERGIPEFPIRKILEETELIRSGLPVVVLGRRRHGESDNRGSPGGALLQVGEIERLPSAIERALRQQQARNSQDHLRVEMDRAARLIARNQKLATIGRLTGSIAHEINNPLEAITNLLFLLERSELPPSAREYLAIAQRELNRVILIARQTLNFYRESPAPIRVGLAGLLDEVVVLYSHRIAQKQIEVVRRFVNDDPLAIFPGEVRQVFSNLISNAIEASTAQGRLHLRLRKSRFWADPKVIGMRVTIADEGEGIPAKIRSRVGEAFFTTKGETGTGLGLWVSQSIVRSYGGNLLLRSSTGKRHGTVFTLFLPANLRPQAVTPAAGAKTAENRFAESRSDAGQEQEEESAKAFIPGVRPLAS